MKYIFILAVCTIFPWLSMLAQTSNSDDSAYSVERNMPTFFEDAKASLTFPSAWDTVHGKHFARWRKKARSVLWECMENIPPAAKPQYEVTDCEQRNGYDALKIRFNVSAYERIPAYLLVPHGSGPFPAILMLHDHGAHFSIGKEKNVKPFHVPSAVIQDAEAWSIQCYDGIFVGDYYAEHGYVVLAIDALYWGERGQKEGHDYEGQQALASNLLQLGMSWGGVITADDVRSAELLASLPFVDRRRIGALGFSMGAHRAWMLAAATDLVQAAAAVCWMNTTEYLMTLTNNQNKGGSAYSMIIPGIRRYLDYPDVASIACPKPMYFIAGAQDKLFPVAGVNDAYAKMRRVWESQSAGHLLRTEIWDGPHFFNREMQSKTLVFFNTYL